MQSVSNIPGAALLEPFPATSTGFPPLRMRENRSLTYQIVRSQAQSDSTTIEVRSLGSLFTASPTASTQPPFVTWKKTLKL